MCNRYVMVVQWLCNGCTIQESDKDSSRECLTCSSFHVPSKQRGAKVSTSALELTAVSSGSSDSVRYMTHKESSQQESFSEYLEPVDGEEASKLKPAASNSQHEKGNHQAARDYYEFPLDSAAPQPLGDYDVPLDQRKKSTTQEVNQRGEGEGGGGNGGEGGNGGDYFELKKGSRESAEYASLLTRGSEYDEPLSSLDGERARYEPVRITRPTAYESLQLKNSVQSSTDN